MADNLIIDGTLQVNSGLVGGISLATSSATAAATNVSTLNVKAGKITTQAVVIPSDTFLTQSVTNSVIAATDLVFASVQNGTNTGGRPVIGPVTPGAGTLSFTIFNTGATGADNGQSIGGTVSGTLLVSFVAFKA